jgi:hypothetical protein
MLSSGSISFEFFCVRIILLFAFDKIIHGAVSKYGKYSSPFSPEEQNSLFDELFAKPQDCYCLLQLLVPSSVSLILFGLVFSSVHRFNMLVLSYRQL